MPLISTPGQSNTNCYVTVLEADQYFADRTHSSAWDESKAQESALVSASEQLDWYVTWLGGRVDNVQSMDWPRVGAYSKFGTEYAPTDIPKEVKQAVYELALSSLDIDRMADSDLAGLSMVQAGPLVIKTDAKDQNSDAVQPIPTKVWNIISHLATQSSTGTVRLGRA